MQDVVQEDKKSQGPEGPMSLSHGNSCPALVLKQAVRVVATKVCQKHQYPMTKVDSQRLSRGVGGRSRGPGL